VYSLIPSIVDVVVINASRRVVDVDEVFNILSSAARYSPILQLVSKFFSCFSIFGPAAPIACVRFNLL